MLLCDVTLDVLRGCLLFVWFVSAKFCVVQTPLVHCPLLLMSCCRCISATYMPEVFSRCFCKPSDTSGLQAHSLLVHTCGAACAPQAGEKWDWRSGGFGHRGGLCCAVLCWQEACALPVSPHAAAHCGGEEPGFHGAWHCLFWRHHDVFKMLLGARLTSTCACMGQLALCCSGAATPGGLVPHMAAASYLATAVLSQETQMDATGLCCLGG